MMLLTFKSVANPHFPDYLQFMKAANGSACIYFDECHLLVIEAFWQNAYAKLDILFNNVSVQQIFLSEMLSQHLESFIVSSLNLWSEKTTIIYVRNVRQNISYWVTVVSDQTLTNVLEILVHKQQHQEKKSFIFICFISDVNDVILVLKIISYTVQLFRSEQSRIHSDFNSGVINTAVVITVFESEMNIDDFILIVHYQSAFNLIELQQQISRADQQNQSAVFVLLFFKFNHSSMKSSQNKALNHVTLRNYITIIFCWQKSLSKYFDTVSSQQCLKMKSAACDLCVQWLSFKFIEISALSVKLTASVEFQTA